MTNIDQLNQLRKTVFGLYAASAILIVIGIPSLAFGGIGIGILVVGVGLLIFNLLVYAKRFKTQYKETIVRAALDEMFEVKEYIPNKGFTSEFVNECYFVPTGNTFESDDYVEASYHGVHFERSDVTCKQVTSNGKTTTTVTLFEGTWTIFDLPKHISSYMLLREKEFLGGGKPGGWLSGAPTTHKVQFEDVAFNDKFEVYAQDEHDAFYLMSPIFMEQVKKVEAAIEGRLFIGIKDEQLHVIFNTDENMMEPSTISEVKMEDVEEIKKSLQYIIEIIEAFDLENQQG